MNIQISDLEGWKDFQQEFEHLIPSEDRLNRALTSAISRTTAWLKTRAVRELSAYFSVPPQLLFKRFKKFRIVGKFRGHKLWLGLNGIPFENLRPVRDNHGVTTLHGNYHENGAFLITRKKTGRTMVLKRRGKTWKDKNVEGQWERGPVDRVTLSIEEGAIRWIEAAIQDPSFEKKLFERLEHELEWRMTQ